MARGYDNSDNDSDSDRQIPAQAPAAVAPSKALLACSMRNIDMAKRAVLAAAARIARMLKARIAWTTMQECY